MLIFPQTRIYFQIENDSQTALMAFLWADLLLMAGGSLITAILLFSSNKYAGYIAWFTFGAVFYAVTYCFSFVIMTDVGWIGIILMAAAALWTGVFTVSITVGNNMFRRSAPASTNKILFKTYSQIVVVWSVVLLIIPYLLTLLEDRANISRFEFAYQQPIASVLFVLVSLIGLSSAGVMSRVGKGTPLPLDHASELVTSGVYAFVRNPMAVSGILQGLLVAVFLGSPLTVVYAFMGSAIWQFIFRPLEEEDLIKRFGEEFENYRKSVRCWIPHIAPYQKGSNPDSSSSRVLPSGKM